MNDENVNNENINIICTVESKEKYLCDDCLYCCEYEKKSIALRLKMIVRILVQSANTL